MGSLDQCSAKRNINQKLIIVATIIIPEMHGSRYPGRLNFFIADKLGVFAFVVLRI